MKKIENVKNTMTILGLIFLGLFFISCSGKDGNQKKETIGEATISTEHMMEVQDDRISLQLNGMQKQHQLKNMRSHLEAVQQILVLLAADDYEKASEVAYAKLGSTTEMKMMCASFGDKEFENLGLEFHKSADAMSEVFKQEEKDSAMQALATTVNYCVRCHATYRQ